MEALQVANQFWKAECRDDELIRLRKQKHAAQSQVCRLKKKIKEQDIARGLLTLAYIATCHSNDILHSRIRRYVQDLDEL